MLLITLISRVSSNQGYTPWQNCYIVRYIVVIKDFSLHLVILTSNNLLPPQANISSNCSMLIHKLRTVDQILLLLLVVDENWYDHFTGWRVTNDPQSACSNTLNEMTVILLVKIPAPFLSSKFYQCLHKRLELRLPTVTSYTSAVSRYL